VKVTSAVRSEASRQSARHTLYVEGNERSIDFQALNELLERSIPIKGLGPGSNVAAVAKSLFADHPMYYFLIDRDAQSDEEVERSWANFPDPTKNNLIIWPKKEIENYFIDPTFVVKSDFFVGGTGAQEPYILRLQEEATKRIFCEAANRVIIETRETLKERWIECFAYTEGAFQSFEETRGLLLERPEYQTQVTKVSSWLTKEHLTQLLEREVDSLLGGKETCEYGVGKWLELMSGKELLHTVVHGTGFFRVIGADGRPLQGEKKLFGLLKNLLRRDEKELPEDFQRLRSLIQSQVKKDGI